MIRLAFTQSPLIRMTLFLTLLLAIAVLPLGISAQEICDPTFTPADYQFYALDAAMADDLATAEALYACWEDTFPADGQVFLDRSAVRAQIQGDFDGALEDIDRAEEFVGGSVIIPARRLTITLAQGDFETAIGQVEELMQDNRYRILGESFAGLRRAAYQGLGIALVEEGRYEAALEALEIAVERLSEEDLTPADGPLILAISEAFRNTGQLEQATRGYTAYVEFMGDAADPAIVALVEALEADGMAAFFAGSTVMRAELATEVPVGGGFSPFPFSPDGSVVALFFFRQRRVQLYDTASGAPLGSVDVAGDLPGFYAFNADGSRIAVIGSDGSMAVRDTASGEVVFDLPVVSGRDRPAGLGYAGDELIILVSSGEVRRYDAETGRAGGPSELDDPLPPLAGITFSADGGSIAVVPTSAPNTVTQYSLRTGEQTARFEVGGSPIISDWTGDLRFAAVVRSDVIAIWTTAFGGNEVQRFEFENDLSRNASLDAAGEALVFGDETGLITTIDLIGGTRTVIGLHNAEIAYVEVSPDGRLAAVVDRDGTVRLWEVPSGE
ncbi:MAG: PQQ-binding-like beta-propeller repeat protein [Chloroflexi bacterium]|nr:PQQ-binding-like beta-propeller repeat protein [Chloroflexota bacterium]